MVVMLFPYFPDQNICIKQKDDPENRQHAPVFFFFHHYPVMHKYSFTGDLTTASSLLSLFLSFFMTLSPVMMWMMLTVQPSTPSVWVVMQTQCTSTSEITVRPTWNVKLLPARAAILYQVQGKLRGWKENSGLCGIFDEPTRFFWTSSS